MTVAMILTIVSLLCALSGLVGGESQQNNSGSRNEVYSVYKVAAAASWVTKFPNLPLLFATSPKLPDGRCKDQTQRYLRELDNATLWAVQMYDASTKYPDGIIYGHKIHLGNFDQCYDLQVELPRNEGFADNEEKVEGRYCMVRLHYRRQDAPSSARRIHSMFDDPNSSAWEAVEDRGDIRKVKRNSIYVALCVPAECSAADVAAAIAQPIAELGTARGLTIDATVATSWCQARGDSPKYLPTDTKIFCGILLVLILLVIGCSWYDDQRYTVEEVARGSGSDDMLVCFSVRRNIDSILRTDLSGTGLDCIHLIRFYLTLPVIMGHGALRYSQTPVTNPKHFEHFYTIRSSMLIFNGQATINGFFAISGLLLAFCLLEELDRRGRFNPASVILVRLFRIIPMYALAVFSYVYLVPHLGSGPLWELYPRRDADRCAKHWWANFLFVNNYVNADESCMLQSWYLSVDMQLYVAGAICIWIFWKLPRHLGYSFLILSTMIGLAIPFAVTYTENMTPYCRVLSYITEPRNDWYFVNYYIKSHMRIAPYMIGILAGTFLRDYKNSKWRLSKKWSRLLFILVVPSCTIGNQLLGAKYYDLNYDYKLHPIESAAYSSLHKAAYALGICSIVVLITIGDGMGSYYNFLTPRWVPPLSKLCYGAFLFHSIYQVYDVGVFRGSRSFSFCDYFLQSSTDIICAFAVSFLASIAVEQPLQKLGKMIFTGKTSSRIRPSNVAKKLN